MEDIFVEPNKIILRPIKRSNCIFVILIGNVSILPNTHVSQEILRQLVF